jgi:hypothetical protein
MTVFYNLVKTLHALNSSSNKKLLLPNETTISFLYAKVRFESYNHILDSDMVRLLLI